MTSDDFWFLICSCALEPARLTYYCRQSLRQRGNGRHSPRQTYTSVELATRTNCGSLQGIVSALAEGAIRRRRHTLTRRRISQKRALYHQRESNWKTEKQETLYKSCPGVMVMGVWWDIIMGLIPLIIATSGPTKLQTHSFYFQFLNIPMGTNKKPHVLL